MIDKKTVQGMHEAVREAALKVRRIVEIDGYLIAQFNDGVTGWWTCSKANDYKESDFAVWVNTPANLEKAYRLFAPVVRAFIPLMRTSKKPVQSARGWTSGVPDLPRSFEPVYHPSTPEGYRQALRELARSI